MRPRQVQADAVGGGRLLSDTRYDSHGRVYKSTQPYYNSAARDTALWLASDTEVPSLTLSQYDGASRPVATVYQAGATEKWRTTTAYGGDRVHVTPPAGGTATTTITDARSRTVEVRQYSAPTPVGDYDSTRYRYTPTGQMAEMIDPAGNTWRHTYDLRGRKTRTEDPDRGVSFSTFDDANRLTSTTDSRDITIAHTYDALGRKTATLRDNVTGPKLAEWTYDTAVGGVGLPATSTRFDDGHAYIGSVFSYDAFGRPTERSVTIPAKEGLLTGRYTAFYNWDTDGGLSGESYPKTPDLRQETVNYVRDGDGRYLSSSGAYDGTVNLVTGTEYTRYGEPQRIQLGKTPKRAWLSYYYDTNDRRLNRTIVDAEVARPMQADLNYTYDLAGNITGIADTVQEQPADTQRFRYDYLRRLTQAWTQGAGCVADPSIAVVGGPSPYWHSYTYDKTGDRATEIHHNVTGDTQRTYAYPVPGTSQPHTLASVTTSRPGQSPTVDTYKYDQAGNTIRRTRDGDEESLTWDAEGHLSTITNAGGTTTSVYDAEGQLLVRRDPTGSTLLLDRQEVRQDKGATVTKTTRYYTFVGKTIASRQGPALTWLATDHQSTSQISIDTATMTAAKRRQYPFGDPRGAEPTMWQGLHGFVGGTKDLSTGLTRLGVRDYDPMVGRFLSVDPIQDPADPQQWNGYSYANNSPITFSDPTGLVPYPGEENTDRLGRHHGGDGMGGATVDQSPTTRGPVVTSDHGNNVRTTHVPRTKEKWANDVQLPPSAPDLQELGRRMSERFGRGLHGRPGGQVHMKETLLALMAACGTLSEDFCSDDFHHWAMYEYLEILAMTGELSGTRGIAKRGDGFTSTQGRNFPGRRAPGSCEGHSFIAGTEVLMADETHKKIEDVEIGDLVIATDSETGRTEARPVVRTWAHGDEFERTEIVVDTDGDAGSAGGTVTATDWHRIWEPTLKEWTPIGELSVGSRVQSSTGESAQVVAVVKYKGAGKVYDLSIEGIHTYYVGTAGIGADLDVLVHNTPPSNRCAVFSSIGDDEFLIKAAQKAGRSQAVQAEMDDLIAKYARGLKDPGLGTKALGQGTDISYLRGDNGARVFFRTTNEGIQIVGKADKRSEDSVISRLKQIYGR